MGQFKGVVLILILLVSDFDAHAESRYPAAEQARDQVFKTFHDDVHPTIIGLYDLYLKSYGNRIGESVYTAYSYLAPKTIRTITEMNDFVYNSNPKFFEESEKIPAPFKIIFEKFMYALYGLNYTVRELPTNKPLEIGAIGEVGTLSFKVIAGIIPTPRNQNLRLNKLLDDLRPYIADKQLASCFRAHAVPVKYELVSTTGCNIFVFEELYNNFTDAEIRAILAHEISHVITGDSLKRFGLVLKTISYHLSKLSIEELNWIVTGETLEYLEKTGLKGNLPIALETLNKDMQNQELRADKNGVILLNAAGFSGNDALAAMDRAGERDNVVVDNFNEAHPPGYKRIRIIKKTMKF